MKNEDNEYLTRPDPFAPKNDTGGETISWHPIPEGTNPLFQRGVDSKGRRCSRMIRDATPEEEAKFNAQLPKNITLTQADIDHGMKLWEKIKNTLD